ncbi:MAG: diguanylate cyclase [Lachnospiraceae bacterium]|nr:diguanylate cyclase [Lachnospiraceae bacterium]
MKQIKLNLFLSFKTEDLAKEYIPDKLSSEEIGCDFFFVNKNHLKKVAEIKSIGLPGDEGVADITEKEEDVNSITDEWNNILLTDLPSLCELVKSKFVDFDTLKNLYIILCSDEVFNSDNAEEIEKSFNISADEADTIFEKLYDIWPLNVSKSKKLKYIVAFFEAFKNKYDAWLYKSFLNSTIDSIPELIWYKDIKGAHEMVNANFCETVHKTKEQVEGRGHYYIWDISQEEYSTGEYICMESEEEVISKKETCVFEEPVKTSEGMKLFVTYKSPLFDPNGDVFGTVGVAHDMTDFSNIDIKLSIIVENLPYPLMLCNNNMRPIRFNSSFKKIFDFEEFNYESFDYEKWKANNLIAESERVEDESGVSVTQNVIYKKNGETFYFKLMERKIIDYFGNMSGYYCIFRNQTKERLSAEKIMHMATTDYLTGLNNRRNFYSYLNEIKGKPFTMLYMDLDKFKEVNDKYGHSKGDSILRCAANIINDEFTDGVSARLGGDEFGVILDGIYEEDVIKKMIDTFKLHLNKTMIKEYDTDVSISVGVSVSDGSLDVDEAINISDHEMYKDKISKR